MANASTFTTTPANLNTVLHGDCAEIMGTNMKT